MAFRLNNSHQLPVIELEGKFLGSLEGVKFKETLNALCTEGDIHIIVDLSKVDFIDSSGIGVLIAGLSTLRNKEGDIRLAGMQQRIKAVFLMTKLLGSVFELYDDVEHAIRSFEKDAEMV